MEEGGIWTWLRFPQPHKYSQWGEFTSSNSGPLEHPFSLFAMIFLPRPSCFHICTPPQIKSLLLSCMWRIRLIIFQGHLHFLEQSFNPRSPLPTASLGMGLRYHPSLEEIRPEKYPSSKRHLENSAWGTPGIHKLELENHVKGIMAELLVLLLQRNKAPELKRAWHNLERAAQHYAWRDSFCKLLNDWSNSRIIYFHLPPILQP